MTKRKQDLWENFIAAATDPIGVVGRRVRGEASLVNTLKKKCWGQHRLLGAIAMLLSPNQVSFTFCSSVKS